MDPKNWKTLNKKLVYKSPHVKVWENEVVRPNGNKGPYNVVERPDFSIIIPLTPKKTTYLVGQYRYAVSNYSWEFPMGATQTSDFLDMAKDELKQETGITAKTWFNIGKFLVAPGIMKQTANLFIAQDLILGEAEPEINEILEVKEIPLEKLSEMIKNQEILDGPTICAYHLLNIYLNK